MESFKNNVMGLTEDNNYNSDSRISFNSYYVWTNSNGYILIIGERAMAG